MHWFVSFLCTWAPGSFPVHASHHEQLGLQSGWTNTLTFLLWTLFPSATPGFVSLLLPDAHHMFLVVLPIIFLCCHKNKLLSYTFLCLLFQRLPLNSKLHKGRELSFLFTNVYSVQHSACHMMGVSQCAEWMDCWITWTGTLCRESQALMNYYVIALGPEPGKHH